MRQRLPKTKMALGSAAVDWKDRRTRHPHTPAQRAALEAAIPRIQAPVGWRLGLALGVIAWVLSGVVVLPLIGAGLFGVNLPVGVPTVLLSLFVPALVFGISLPLLQPRLRWLATWLISSPRLQRRFSPSRRRLLKQDLAENPEEAHAAEPDLGRSRSDRLNGLDRDATRARPPAGGGEG